jgi:hypothetical protein
MSLLKDSQYDTVALKNILSSASKKQPQENCGDDEKLLMDLSYCAALLLC